MGFAPIPLLGKCSGYEVHHLADPFNILRMHNDMDMITGNGIPINRNPVTRCSLAQPAPVRIAIPRKLQKKATIMTAMSQVI